MALIFRRFIAAITLFGYVFSFLGLPQFCCAVRFGELLTEDASPSPLLVSRPPPSQGAHLIPVPPILLRPSEEELQTLLESVPRHFPTTSLASSLQKTTRAPWWTPDTFLSLTWKDSNKKHPKGSLKLPLGYDYATAQGQRYVSTSLSSSTAAGAQWTCVLDKETLFFDYKPSQHVDTTLSFTLHRRTLRITKMSTLEAHIQFRGDTLFDWKEDLNGPCNVLNVASLNIINNSLLIPQKFKFYAHHYTNQEHSEGGEGFFCVEELINIRQTLQAQKLKINAGALNNEGGHLLGQETNDISVSRKLRNNGGEIASEGRTSLSLALEAVSIEDLGTIRGAQTFILDQSKKALTFKNGSLQGTKRVTIQTPFFKGIALDIKTPFCVMNVEDFCLPPQSQCARLILSLKDSQNFISNHAFKTEGSFEIWQKGLSTQEDVDRAIAERFPEGGPVPAFEQTIHLKSPLSARLLRIFVPKAKVRLGEETGPLLDVLPPLDILMEKGNTDIAATIFDLERAIFASQNATIHAPGGITFGRLETDPEKQVFVPFCWHGQQARSRNLGRYISRVSYDFRGQRLTNTYDDHVLSRLPFVKGNNSSFEILYTTTLKGPLIQQATFKSHDLNLSSKTALFEASTTNIQGDLTFKKDCTVTLQRATGIFNFTYQNYEGGQSWPTRPYTEQSFVNSDGAMLRVEGRLLSEKPVTIINKASTLYASNKSPTVIVQDQILKSDLFQKTFEGRAELDRLATQPCGEHYRVPSGCSHIVAGSLIAAENFLAKTNNFAGAVNTFTPTTTFGKGVIFGAHEPMPLSLSTPLAIVLIGQEGRVIGLTNPHTVQAQSPLSNLMEAPLNFGTVKLNLPSEALSSHGLFKFQERFWFDVEKAKRFYKSIQDHIVLFSPEGIFQKLDRPLLTLSPKLLLERIQEAVQKKLGRGYVDHGKPIDETYVRELHENATEHLRSFLGSVLRGTGLALRRQDAINIPLSQKPLIYYKEVVDETGEVSLSPEMSFPEHLLNPMGSVRNAKIHVGMLLAISEGMTLNDAQKCFEGSPAQLAILSAIIQDRPNLLALMDAEGHDVLALEESDDLPSQELVLSKISHGPLALHGDFETNTMAVLSAGKVMFHGDTRINTIHALLASLFDDVEAQAWIECIPHSKGYNNVLKGCFEIAAEGALCISAGRDLSLVAAKTRSKLITYFQARRDTFDIPAVLQSYFSETFGSKNNKRTETRSSSLSIASQHTSEGAFVSSAGRHNTHQGNKVEAESIVEHGGLSHQQLPSYNTLSASSTSSQKGSFGAKKSSQSSYASATSIPCERISRSTVMHLSPHQALVGSTITAEGQVFLLTLGDLGEIQFRVRRDTTQSSTVSSTSSGFWSVQKQSGDGLSIPHSVVINSPFPIKVSATSLSIEEASGSPSIKDKIETSAHIESLLAQIETQSSHTSHSGPTALTAGLVALTIAIATQGWCAGLVEGLAAGTAAAAAAETAAAAAMGSLLGTFGGALLTTQGDIVASLKQTLRPDALKNAVAVGMTAGACHQFIPSQEALNAASKTVPTAATTAPTLTSHVLPHVGHAALQIPIETAVHTVVGTKSMGEAFRGAVLNGASQAVHRSAANALGANATDLGAIGHKIGHLAAATTASHISSGGKDFTSSLINGANAVLGEMLMETMVNRELETAALKEAHPDLSPEELNQRFQEQTANRKHLAIWTSGALGGLFGGDVGTSASLANTAIDHNYMTTSKKLFYEDEEEEVTAEERFLRRYTEENNDPEEGSQFGVEEEKKVRAALGGTSSRPHTQQEYARALDPSGFIARSVGRRYEGSTPAHAALSEVLTPQWQSEVRASVHRFDAFMAETETMKPSQRVQIGEDFRKAQAFSKEELNQRPRSNSAAEREMAAYFWALTENQDPEVEAANVAGIDFLEVNEEYAQAQFNQEEATGWMERIGALEVKRDALDDLTDATGEFSHTVPNETALGIRRAFQERNKPLVESITQQIQEKETFRNQNPDCPITHEERQDLFDLYETREFIATAHLHIPVNIKQGIGTGVLIGTTFMPMGKLVAEGPRYLAKAFSATSKAIRAAEARATRMLQRSLTLQKGKSALLKISGISLEQKEITSYFGGVIQEAEAAFIQGTQKSATLEALNLETFESAKSLRIKRALTGSKKGRVTGVEDCEVHHIISHTNEHTKDHDLWRAAGMDPQDRLNKMILPKPKGKLISTTYRTAHQGRHLDKVFWKMKEDMTAILEEGLSAGWTKVQYKEKLEAFISQQRALLKSGEKVLYHSKPGVE